MLEYKKSIAVMQPYIFPYVGYFHLAKASDMFVFYDDVNFIKRGWINRNRILNQGEDMLFTVPLSKVSQNKMINEISTCVDDKWKDGFFRQLSQSYKKAPYFKDVVDPVMEVFLSQYDNVADMAIASIKAVFTYLGSEFNSVKSSVCSPETKGMDRADRLIEITKKLGFSAYINASEGKKLYSKEYFSEKGVDLSFIKSELITYDQGIKEFVPWLSIIDLLMFNNKERVVDFMEAYSLE
jgi:hypothetical protein